MDVLDRVLVVFRQVYKFISPLLNNCNFGPIAICWAINDSVPAVGSKMGINDEDEKKLGHNSELNSIHKPKKRSLYFYFGTPNPMENKEEKPPK